MASQPDTATRTDASVETDLHYRPGDPVRVHVIHREQRVSVTDDGAAFDRAGRPRQWKEAARRVAGELDVNISRSGVVSLPVVAVGPSEHDVIRRIGEASLAFYQELLELSG